MTPLPASDIPSWWPHRASSRRVRVVPHDWHVQLLGAGPDVLLLHGTGASGHSWRKLVPLLPDYRLILPDLPGQGFTRAGNRMRLGIDAMAQDLAALMADQGWHPAAIVGHSAGAALALRLAELLPVPPRALVGINAALGTFEGVAGWLFPKLAKLMAATPLIGRALAGGGRSPGRVERMLTSVGSRLDAEGVRLYGALMADPRHIDGTLAMMAQWDLEPLLARLERIAPPTLLIAAEGDSAVPARISQRAAGRLPQGHYASVAGHGHLLHEEAAPEVAALILPWLARHLDAPGAARAVPG